MSIEKFAWAQPQPRIVQYNKKRFALRLESVFWEQLERLARKRGQRIGQLVNELSESSDGPNVSSFIRGFCMLEAEREANRLRLTAGAFDLVDILRGCPAPALLLRHDRTIFEVNQSLLDWIAPSDPEDAPIMRQQKFDDVFKPRTTRTLDETIALMRSGQLKRTQFQVAYAAKDEAPRTVMATLTGLSVGNIFYVLVWLTVSSPYRMMMR